MAEALCPSPLDAATKRGFIQFHGAELTDFFLLSKGFLPQARLLESFAERLCEPQLLFGLEVHCLLLEFIFCLDNLNLFLCLIMFFRIILQYGNTQKESAMLLCGLARRF